MIPAGKGRIINITSYAGVYRWPLLSAYAASQAALVKLTETLAEETRPHGVSVFSVDPGLLPIGLGEAALKAGAGGQTPEGRVHRWIRDQLAAGRSAWSCLRIVPVRPGRWPTQARAARALVKKLMFVPGTRPAGPATQPVRHAFRGVAVGL